MKWNWGTKLLIGMILFILFILTFVFLSTKQTFNLVEKDYYPKGLEYQTKLDKISNSGSLKEKVLVENTGDYLVFKFQRFFKPSHITGNITLYRPSGAQFDLSFPIEIDSLGKQSYDIREMQKGKYIVQIDYKVDGKEYYQEQSVFLKMF